MIEVGGKAPGFCLPAPNQEEVCLKDLQGRWVALYFYPKDNTSGCTAEALEFSELKAQFEEAGAFVCGVSPDSVESHRKFIQKHDIKITLLSDKDKEVLQLFGAWGKKKMYGKEHEGVIRSTVLIDPQGIVRWTWPSAKSKGHAIQVLDRLKSLVQ